MAIKEITIESWLDFNEKVFNNSYDLEISRFRSPYVFRGLTSVDFKLETSLQRKCGHNLNLESSLIRNFKKYASLEIRDLKNEWEVISLAQHHGLPTRFLDWSYSPFIALHFATEDTSSVNDGIVWCTKLTDIKNKLPKSLKNVLDGDKSFSFTIESLYSKVDSLEELKTIGGFKEYAIFLEPHSIDSRIINQYALFMFMSKNNVNIEDWLDKNTESIKLVIPSNLKLEFRDKLDQLNINERIIYPGLDGLSKWLTRNYADHMKMYKEVK